MNRDRNGFTLVELLAVIILLSIIMGIGTVSVTSIINNAKERDYQKLIGEIGNALEVYYQECKNPPKDKGGNDIINCPVKDANGYYNIKLIDLVENGYLKGNATGNGGNMTLVNPKDRDKNISDCQIKYKFNNGKMKIEKIDNSSFENDSYCPTSCDYDPDDSSCVEG